ncbi:MAG: 50S ribosomal protein L15e [Candidatus Pacearchaeota archaeon]|nr:50S ribosomal protein L15e [Candidatus Pacearchaeota archaeon]
MAKGLYTHLRELWREHDKELVRERMIKWREGNVIEKVEKPLRLDKARMLGYKAKKGFVVFRVRIKRGGRKRPRHTHGRKSRKQHERKILKMSYQWVAEQRVEKRYPNLEILNSYYLGKDGKHYFFEVIAVDPSKPEIKNDKTINWICKPENQNRAARGLTSAAKKSRGLKKKSPNLKVRPSLRAWNRQGK